MYLKIDGEQINPVMFHAAGRVEYNELWVNLAQIPIEKWQTQLSVEIITWNQETNGLYNSYKKLGLFELCCDKLGVICNVLQSPVKSWQNRLKIPLTLDYLKKSSAQFIIAADSSDVFAFGVPDPAVLDLVQCDMLFNAETQFWPSELMELKLKEDEYEHGRFCYLNSGLWIARREYAISVFQVLNKMYEENIYPQFPNSDQVLFKKLYIEEYPSIKIDAKCNVFFNCSHVKASDVKFQNIQHKEFI